MRTFSCDVGTTPPEMLQILLPGSATKEPLGMFSLPRNSSLGWSCVPCDMEISGAPVGTTGWNRGEPGRIRDERVIERDSGRRTWASIEGQGRPVCPVPWVCPVMGGRAGVSGVGALRVPSGCDSLSVACGVGVGLVGAPPLQGQQDQRGLRFGGV